MTPTRQTPAQLALRKTTDDERRALELVADGRWDEADDDTLMALGSKGFIRLYPIEPTPRGEFAITALKQAA